MEDHVHKKKIKSSKAKLTRAIRLRGSFWFRYRKVTIRIQINIYNIVFWMFFEISTCSLPLWLVDKFLLFSLFGVENANFSTAGGTFFVESALQEAVAVVFPVMNRQSRKMSFFPVNHHVEKTKKKAGKNLYLMAICKLNL